MLSECCTPDVSLNEDGVQVAIYIAGYIATKLRGKFPCCHDLITSNDVAHLLESRYFQLLSSGSLTVPSSSLADFVIETFAILEYFDAHITNFPNIQASLAAKIVLEKFGPSPQFTCEKCIVPSMKKAMKIVINIFFNNKRKIVTDSVRKNHVEAFKKRQRSKPE